MKEKEFAQLVEAFGADPARWPADRREAGVALLRTSPAAQGLAAEAEALDRLLAAAEVPPGTALSAEEVAARICAEPQPRPQRSDPARAAPGRGWEIRIAWPNLVGLAMAGIMGFVVGWSGLDIGLAPGAGPDTAQLLYGTISIEDSAW